MFFIIVRDELISAVRYLIVYNLIRHNSHLLSTLLFYVYCLYFFIVEGEAHGNRGSSVRLAFYFNGSILDLCGMFDNG